MMSLSIDEVFFPGSDDELEELEDELRFVTVDDHETQRYNFQITVNSYINLHKMYTSTVTPLADVPGKINQTKCNNYDKYYFFVIVELYSFYPIYMDLTIS